MAIAGAPPQPRTFPPWSNVLPSLENNWACAALLLALCGGLFFYGIHAGELYRTEGLRALVARGMFDSGDWIVPRLYGQPLYTKPPGMYLAIVLCSLPFGAVSEWTARLPSALAASATVLLFFWYFQRNLGRQAGVIAALLVPLSVFWLEKASAAEIDMLQVAWVSAAILFYMRALEAEEDTARDTPPRRTFGWWLAALVCVAGGSLTKWTAPAFFYVAAIPLLCWRGRWQLLFGRRHLLSAALAAALVLGWIAAAVAQTGWDVFYSQVSREALNRLAPGYTARGYSWLEGLAHPLLILGATLPCSALALATLRPGFLNTWDARGRRLVEGLHCWVWPNLLFWSLHNEHTLRNRAPLFPGIAGLAAMALFAWHKGTLSWPRLPLHKVLAGALVVWLAVKVAYVEVVVPRRNAVRQLRSKAGQLTALAPWCGLFYIFRVKDESLLFYVDRPVLRLEEPRELPLTAGPVCCILTEKEWREWPGRPAQELGRLTDGQGDAIVLVQSTEEN